MINFAKTSYFRNRQTRNNHYIIYNILFKNNQNCLVKYLTLVDGNRSEMLTTQLAQCDHFNLLKLSIKNVTFEKVLLIQQETSLKFCRI